ncbi:MAG: RNB domain-containing ribonuclease [bacterium]
MTISTKEKQIVFSMKERTFNDCATSIEHPYSKATNMAYSTKEKENGFELNILLSDITEIIKRDDLLDRQARLIGFTRFSNTNPIFMFPEPLIDTQLSLKTENKNSCILISCHLNQDFLPETCNFSQASLKQSLTLSFQAANHLLEQNTDQQSTKHIRLCLKIANGLYKQRKEKKALCYFNNKNGLTCQELGILTPLDSHKNFECFLIQQEFQLLCQQLIASFFQQSDTPGLFYNHSLNTTEDKRQELIDLLEKETLSTDNITSYNNKLKKISNKAFYDTNPTPFFSQNLACYLFICDPIYRYPSLVNLRILKSLIKNTPIPYQKNELLLLSNHLNILQKNISKTNSNYNYQIKLHHTQNIQNSNDLSIAINDELLSKQNVLTNIENYLKKHLYENSILPTQLYQLTILSKENPSFKNIQENILNYLKNAPGLAIQIINIACQITSTWDNYELIDESTNMIFIMRVCITINKERKTTKLPYTNKRKQLAKDLAAVGFIQHYLTNSLVNKDEKETLTIKTPQEKEKNIISELNEQCQKRKWNISYQTNTMIGQNKLPLFIITLSINTETKTFQSTGKSNRKKEAKEIAYQEMKNNFSSEIYLATQKK